MNRYLFYLLLFSFVIAGNPQVVLGINEVECIIFSGSNNENEKIPLMEFNKISIGSNSFIISSNMENITEEIVLPYAEFNHIEFGNAIPTVSALLESLNITPNSHLSYNMISKELKIESLYCAQNILMLVAQDGKLILSLPVSKPESIYLGHLPPGLYIAVIKNNLKQEILKIIIE